MGLVCPPKPFCFASYRRLPWATRLAFWLVCLLHFLQYVFRSFGMQTMAGESLEP